MKAEKVIFGLPLRVALHWSQRVHKKKTWLSSYSLASSCATYSRQREWWECLCNNKWNSSPVHVATPCHLQACLLCISLLPGCLKENRSFRNGQLSLVPWHSEFGWFVDLVRGYVPAPERFLFPLANTAWMCLQWILLSFCTQTLHSGHTNLHASLHVPSRTTACLVSWYVCEQTDHWLKCTPLTCQVRCLKFNFQVNFLHSLQILRGGWIYSIGSSGSTDVVRLMVTCSFCHAVRAVHEHLNTSRRIVIITCALSQTHCPAFSPLCIMICNIFFEIEEVWFFFGFLSTHNL